MGIEDAFLCDILAHPDDDAPRLIYADWLEERNDPRGEFIRVQCALAQLSDEDSRRWPLEEREQDLLREHQTKWLPQSIGTIPYVFRRGFVEQIALQAHEFLTVAEALFEQAPIRHVSLRERPYSAGIPPTFDIPMLQAIAQWPRLAQLRELSLPHGFCLHGHELRSLSASPYLDNLTDLKLCVLNLEEDALNDWAGAILRPGLRSLDLSDSGGSRSAFFRALAQAPQLSSLRRLNIAHTGVSIDNLRFLADSSSLASLRELNLNGNHLTHEATTVLAESRLLSQLEKLHLESNLLGDAGALIVREWPALPRLTGLSLGHNHIFAAGAQALAEAPALNALISLDLFGNISCNAGVAALASSFYLSQLRTLNLRFNGVGDNGVRALARSEALDRLTWLNLTANRITGRGARALSKAPKLSSLVRLDLLRNDIAAREQAMLRQRFGPFVTCWPIRG
jgi:uncharacterized protein (TIGR02996 family)